MNLHHIFFDCFKLFEWNFYETGFLLPVFFLTRLITIGPQSQKCQKNKKKKRRKNSKKKWVRTNQRPIKMKRREQERVISLRFMTACHSFYQQQLKITTFPRKNSVLFLMETAKERKMYLASNGHTNNKYFQMCFSLDNIFMCTIFFYIILFLCLICLACFQYFLLFFCVCFGLWCSFMR